MSTKRLLTFLTVLSLLLPACGSPETTPRPRVDAGPTQNRDAGPSGPLDSDRDGMPDSVDTDDDNNGVPDTQEPPGDFDMDGIPDARDLDDDNDGLSDMLESGGTPGLDSDMDGMPNAQDLDSDNDTIGDSQERDVDTDSDTVPDRLDTDSDADGLSDAREAGDANLATPPVDSDSDGDPDFRDTDSDDDGLSDTAEDQAMTNPQLADSDMDGVSDLIEVGAGTDANNGMDSPRTRGDFVFVVPYQEPPAPPRDTLRFKTSIQFADLYFLFDSSTSMDGEINALRDAVTMLMGNLTCQNFMTPCMLDQDCAMGRVCGPTMQCIEDPAVRSCIPSPWSGGGSYGSTLRNRLSLQPNPAATSTALNFGTSGGTEALYPSLVTLANGGAGSMCGTPMVGRRGCPLFRDEAVRIIVIFTDEDSDGGTAAAAAQAAMAQGIKLIGVWSGAVGSAARNALVDVVRLSGSLDRNGMPLVFDGANAAVVPAVTMAINELAFGVPLRVTIEAADEPGDAGDALQFVDHLEINGTAAGCTMVTPTEDTNADTFQDAFPALRPGTPVCWDVVARMNNTVMPTRSPQIFKAQLMVRGDGSPLDSRTVYFLVPPKIDPPGIPL